MEKELCLKFLVHLHKCATTVSQKQHIEAVDLVYINNEVDNFRKRLNPEVVKTYDVSGALARIARIPEETAADKAKNISKFLLKAKFKWLALFFGTKDDAHAQREAKVLEFKERIKKILALVEYS